MINEENGKIITYTGKEYYEKFKLPKLIEKLFRVYEQKNFVDRFLIIKFIFNELNFNKNEFVVYDGLGHEINNGIRQDELEFFKRVLKN
ncbi:MAG: hypothetical protein FH751_05640 [Firmicutes bacterium]|nr:hypothetical protein [Bacillota bacterium]